MKKVDLIGRRFGKLTVVEDLGISHSKDLLKSWRGKNQWRCECECGGYLIKYTSCLTRSKYPINNCGCVKRKRAATLNRLPKYQAAKNRLFNGYVHRARRYGKKFELPREEFEKLTQLACNYCGLPPSTSTQTINKHGYGQILYNGLDRVDPKKGYIKGNVVPCCWQCNLAKFRFSYENFMSYIDRLVKFRKK